MPAEVTVYRCGPDNKAIPVDTHDHSPQRPGFDPEDVLKRLDDLTSRIEKLEKEMRPLLGVFRRR